MSCLIQAAARSWNVGVRLYFADQTRKLFGLYKKKHQLGVKLMRIITAVPAAAVNGRITLNFQSVGRLLMIRS
ncbi:hypothetical protein D3C86_1651990 [compost metagenome]